MIRESGLKGSAKRRGDETRREWKAELKKKRPRGQESYGNNLLLMRTVNNYKINIKELYYEKKIFIVNVSISDDGWCIHPIDS